MDIVYELALKVRTRDFAYLEKAFTAHMEVVFNALSATRAVAHGCEDVAFRGSLVEAAREWLLAQNVLPTDVSKVLA